jgi:hypothetical protein
MSEEELNYQSVKKAANCAKQSQVTLPAKFQKKEEAIEQSNYNLEPATLNNFLQNINGMGSY